jgi:adenylyltransferase/sulfurtransferase
VGVLGVVPGQIGLVQATEVLKLILGIGHSLTGRLLVYDALDVEFRIFNFHKNEACPLCGEKPTITGVGASGGQRPAVCPV